MWNQKWNDTGEESSYFDNKNEKMKNKCNVYLVIFAHCMRLNWIIEGQSKDIGK